MLSKSVIVFWSVACLTIFVHLANKDAAGTVYYILFLALIWSAVVIPAAVVGKFFRVRKEKVYSIGMRMLRGGVLTAVGLLTFVIVHASQQPTDHTKAWAKQHPFQTWK